MTVALKRPKTTPTEQPPIASPLPAENKQYEIRDRIRVEAPASGSGVLDLWTPVIPETPYQRVLDMQVTGPGSWQIHREAEFGNLVFHTRIPVPLQTAVEVDLRYVVERLPVSHHLDAALVRPIATAQLFSRVLGLERFVDVNDQTRALARQVVGDEMNILLQARKLYDHVTGTMTYDAAQQS
jgi:hypothetical protein